MGSTEVFPVRHILTREMFNVHAFIIILCVTQERHINQIDEIGNRRLIHQLGSRSVRRLFGTQQHLHTKLFTNQEYVRMFVSLYLFKITN